MVRLTRVQQQARTRAAVLAATRREFIEHGYGPAKIDRIAERAELTRGAVYSNFPGMRALYFAVLVDSVESAAAIVESPAQPDSVGDALGAFAQVWLERLPLVDDTASDGRLQLRSLVGVIDDGPGRTVLAQLMRLEALLLATGLESCDPPDDTARRVRLAELVLTFLSGSGALAEQAPGLGDPFDRIRACEHLATLDLADTWAPPHLPYVEPAEPCRDAWVPPTGLVDRLTGDRLDLGVDGLVTILGAHRLSAAEETVRSAGPGARATVVVVTGDAAETGRLVRLRVGDLIACLQRVFPPDARQRLRLVIDDSNAVAAAIGLDGTGDEAEAAVRVQGGSIVARARGRGAAYATATAAATGTGTRTRTRTAT